jgi:hypothetical protein
MRQLGFEFGDESGVVLVLGVGFFELFDGVGQGFADKTAAVDAKVAAGVGLLVVWTWFACCKGPQGRVGN